MQTANQSNVPFQSIKDACKATGLSMFYLRQGCKDGTVPHIRVNGSKIMVNVPLLLKKLDAESERMGI